MILALNQRSTDSESEKRNVLRGKYKKHSSFWLIISEPGREELRQMGKNRKTKILQVSENESFCVSELRRAYHMH